MLMIAATVAVIAWGALAFGAVYPWAFMPLLAACALTGALGLMLYRARPVSRATRLGLIALLVVIAGGVIQLVPLPAGALRVLSPSTDAFLSDFDLAYSVAGTADGAEAASTTSAAGFLPQLTPC